MGGGRMGGTKRGAWEWDERVLERKCSCVSV